MHYSKKKSCQLPQAISPPHTLKVSQFVSYTVYLALEIASQQPTKELKRTAYYAIIESVACRSTVYDVKWEIPVQKDIDSISTRNSSK